MYGCAQVFAMQFDAGRVVCGGAAELAVYIGTFTFSECITQLLSPPTVYKVAAGPCAGHRNDRYMLTASNIIAVKQWVACCRCRGPARLRNRLVLLRVRRPLLLLLQDNRDANASQQHENRCNDASNHSNV